MKIRLSGGIKHIWMMGIVIFFGLSVQAANIAPTVSDGSSQVAEGGTVQLALRSYDPDVSQTHTVDIISGPSHGTITPGGFYQQGSYRYHYYDYTADAGYTGSDTILWRVSDGLEFSPSATVTITIIDNKAPTATAVSVMAMTGVRQMITLNFEDLDLGQTHMFTLTLAPTNGIMEYHDGAAYQSLSVGVPVDTQYW